MSCVLDQFCLHIQWHQSIVMVCGYESVWGVMGGFSALIQKLCVQNVRVCSVHTVCDNITLLFRFVSVSFKRKGRIV